MATYEYQYRCHAEECLRIADDITNAKNKMLLIAMAQAWLRLARQAEKGLATDIVYQIPSPPSEGPAA
jgi:hypothetical protein